MYTSEKKRLSVMTYIALIAFMITFVVFEFLLLLDTALPLWAQIAYYIVIGLMVLNIIFDIFCTFNGMGKYASGLMLFILTIANVIISFVLGGFFGDRGVIPTDLLGLYGGVIGLAIAINVLAVIIYCLGEKIVVVDDGLNKKHLR